MALGLARGHRKVKGGLAGGRKTEPQRPLGEAQYLRVQTDLRVISSCFVFHLIFFDKLRSAVKKSGFSSFYIYSFNIYIYVYTSKHSSLKQPDLARCHQSQSLIQGLDLDVLS